MESNKPSGLDYILAFSPLPFIGEKRARKIASYLVNEEYKRESRKKVSEIQTDCEITDKIFISRIVGYVFTPTLIYAAYKFPEFLNNLKEITKLLF
jgi:hypothetical protein